MTFSQNARLVTTVTRANQAIRYDYENESIQRRHTYLDTQQVLPERSLPAPLAADVSPDLGIVALMHRGRPVSLWSLKNNDSIRYCDRDAGIGDQPNISVQTALFNPKSNLSLAYQDGDLILFDLEIQERFRLYSADALSLASTVLYTDVSAGTSGASWVLMDQDLYSWIEDCGCVLWILEPLMGVFKPGIFCH